MRRPRSSIAAMMALTALVALDCLAIRSVFDEFDPENDVRFLAVFGGLPMLNVLLVGLPILRKRRRREEPVAFLAGFQAVGWTLLGLHVALAYLYTKPFEDFIAKQCDPLNSLSEMWPPIGLVTAFAILAAMLTTPQLIAAYLGGLLNRRYRLRIERRERETVAP